MAIAFVQSTTGNAAASPTVTTAFGTATTTGNLIVVAISDDAANTATVTGVTDNKSNTYTKIYSTANSATGALWYAKNISGGSAHTVSVAWSTAVASRCTCVAQEFSGLDTTAPLDKSTSPAGVGTSTAPSSGASATTAQADELVVGGVALGGTAATVSLGTGFTNLGTVSVANAGVGMASKVVAATGAQTATFGLSASRSWVCGVATFKGAGGGGGGGGPSGATLGGFLPFL